MGGCSVKGHVLVADAAGAAAVPEVVRDHWDSIEWTFEASGTAALARLRVSRPDLAIVSLQLPDMCGTELVERLRKGLPNLPLLIISSQCGSLGERVGRSLGAIAFLFKPLDAAVLEQVLHSVLGETGAKRPVRSDG